MKPRRVLIVEDEVIVQMHLERIVDELGNRVSGTARTAREALACAEREAPELVLMDVNLPGGQDGIEVARTLREKYDCAVVFATAYADDATIARSADVGAASYLVKPFTNATVRAAIQTALAEHDRQRRALSRERSVAKAMARAAEVLLVTDMEGRVTFVSSDAVKLLADGEAGALGRPLPDVLAAMGIENGGVQDALEQVLASCAATRISGVARRGGDGESRVEVAIEPIAEGDGAACGGVVGIHPASSSHDDSVAARRTGPCRRFGAGSRVLFYSHDTFGLGHLHRSMNLLRSMLRMHEGASALLVTGSPAAHRYELPPGADYVKLPAVQKVAPELYEARSLRISTAGVRTLRRNLLLRTIQDYDPDVVVVDHAPLGMKGEMEPALEWLGQRGGCRRILGLRDITDEPSDVIALWTEKGIYDAIERLYEDVVVYGAKEVYDPIRAYQVPASIASRATHLGYVCDERAGGATVASRPAESPRVALSIGGGDGAASVIEAYLEMLRANTDQTDFHTEILTGPLLPGPTAERLREAARGLPVTFREFMPATADWFASADLVVSTGGYNTITQLLAYARRAIVIPRVLHRAEQLIRARRLEELGLLTCLPPSDLDANTLFDAIHTALANPHEPLREGRARGAVPLDGAENFARFCGGLWHAGRPDEQPGSTEKEARNG